MKTTLKTVFLILCLLLVSCSNTGPLQTRSYPDWLSNIPEGTALGIAGPNLKGSQAQINLATNRARVEYAKRYGFTVSEEYQQETVAVNDTEFQQFANEKTDTKLEPTNIKAKVLKIWSDGKNVYVLVGK